LKPHAFPPAVEDHIRAKRFERPTLVLDTDAVARHYRWLKAGLGRADIHYAVKANPASRDHRRWLPKARAFRRRLARRDRACASNSAHGPSTISFGNTVKRCPTSPSRHAAGHHALCRRRGGRARQDREHAPGAEVYIRLIVDASEADWPLSRKFGCARDKVLLLHGPARDLGLAPVGLSFHVGSQTRDPAMWEPRSTRSPIWKARLPPGFELDLLNIGGGFPAFYGDDMTAPDGVCSRR
jgi:ornithine decarboxylase